MSSGPTCWTSSTSAEGFDLHVRETAVQLVLETRSANHAQPVTDAVREAGYAEPRVLR